MGSALPEIHLVRHGETEWSAAGRHTGRTDIALTAAGEAAARRLQTRLQGLRVAAVWTSPSRRARQTCALAGFGVGSVVDPDLAEWDYGAYEGLTTEQILARRPGWRLFRDGCPDGESVAEIGMRADRVVARLRELGRNALLFSSSHFLRVLAARWLGLPPQAGALLALDTASQSILGYEHDPDEPIIRRWNLVQPG